MQENDSYYFSFGSLYNDPSCSKEYEDFDPLATADQIDEWRRRRDSCCERIENESPPDEPHCTLVWDTWDCWNWTTPGDTLVQPCPWWVPQVNPNKDAMKTCMPDGTWFKHPDTNYTWTNYSNCGASQSTIHVAIFYTGYSVSVISLCLALFIFTYFQSLGCPRVTIHKNLFISFILSCISNITWHITIIASAESKQETACRITHIIAQFFVLCNYFWMLSEGLYLHTVIVVAVFSENHNLLLYYIVGWVIPLVPASVFLSLLLTQDGGRCWTNANEIEWVVGGTIIAVLLTNAALLLNIVRVLVTKLRATPSQGARTYVRAVRATIILLPLMGLHYIIVPVRPSDNHVAEVIYDCIVAFLISFQGLFVACIFCFFNGEVINKLHRSIRNFTLVHYSHNAHLNNAHGTDGPSDTQVSLRCRLGKKNNKFHKFTALQVICSKHFFCVSKEKKEKRSQLHFYIFTSASTLQACLPATSGYCKIHPATLEEFLIFLIYFLHVYLSFLVCYFPCINSARSAFGALGRPLVNKCRK